MSVVEAQRFGGLFGALPLGVMRVVLAVRQYTVMQANILVCLTLEGSFFKKKQGLAQHTAPNMLQPSVCAPQSRLAHQSNLHIVTISYVTLMMNGR